MREFNLANAVAAFSTYSGMLTTLWGLYIAATFAAAGFGATMNEHFTPQTAALMTVAFLAFAVAHLRGIMVIARGLVSMRTEILSRLDADPGEITDYPKTVKAALTLALSPPASCAVHVVIDLCVVAVLWSSIS
ncbi:MAG: hypothetical protein QOJ91_1480 [Sphingomonadales bacterium]|jgi:hypothetical protein|nr:hypothetical protein [Sphingomonadales bacterium]